MPDSKPLEIDQYGYKEITGLDFPKDHQDNPGRTLTEILMAPVTSATFSVQSYMGKQQADVDIGVLSHRLQAQIEDASENESLEFGQQKLAAQAITLDSIFHYYARLAKQQESVDVLDKVLKLALKAQAQSRCTWETISKIKNPPNATFVKQQNVAHGHQQVNNGAHPKNTSRTAETENVPNELLEEQHGERMDFGAQEEASRDDQGLETVGAVHGPKDR